MNSLAQSVGEQLAIDEFNDVAADKINQKDPYNLPVPQGLSKRDTDVLRRCRRRAHQLDHNAVFCHCCPCFFGLNTAICLIPFIGPWWANSLSGRIVRMAEEADIPATLTAKMTANVAFDLLISLPPFVGALFQWMNKCNTRNVALLDTYLRQRAKDNLAKGQAGQTDVITHDPSRRVDTRFADVQTLPHVLQPQSTEPRSMQSRSVPQGRGMAGGNMKSKPPKRGKSGDQEMGVV